jgi:hypothetical protein
MLAMTDLEFTRSEMALMFGVTRETVSRWAGGKMPIPKWVEFALDGVRWRRRGIAKLAPPTVAPVEPAKPAMPVKSAEKPVETPRPAKPVKVAIDCSPAPVPGRWRFGTFYPD